MKAINPSEWNGLNAYELFPKVLLYDLLTRRVKLRQFDDEFAKKIMDHFDQLSVNLSD